MQFSVVLNVAVIDINWTVAARRLFHQYCSVILCFMSGLSSVWRAVLSMVICAVLLYVGSIRG